MAASEGPLTADGAGASTAAWASGEAESNQNGREVVDPGLPASTLQGLSDGGEWPERVPDESLRRARRTTVFVHTSDHAKDAAEGRRGRDEEAGRTVGRGTHGVAAPKGATRRSWPPLA